MYYSKRRVLLCPISYPILIHKRSSSRIPVRFGIDYYGAVMMRKTRTMILSAFALGGLVLGSTASGSAWAVTEKMLEPDSNWSVSKIDAEKTKRGEAYCALARRYEDNIILTFARNGSNESSVALDFQKQELNPLREYNVILEAGYGENRRYDLKPVSSTAVVARLGEDPAFFDALGRGGQLGMRVEDKSYKFTMDDLLDGQKKLNECLVGLPPAEKAGAEKAATQAVAQDHSAAAATSKEIENLRQENLRLRNALERERRTYEDRFMSESVDSSAVSELSEKLRLLEIENGNLHVQLTRLKENVTAGESSCAAPEKAGLDNKEKDRLEALQAENKRLKDNLAAQTKRLALLEKGQDKTGGASDEKEDADKNSMKADVDMLKKTRLQEEEIAILREENKALKAEVEAFRVAGEQERVNISSANWNLEKATRRFNEAEREIRRLGGTLEEERAKCAREKREIEYMLFDPEIAKKEQTARLLELEKELDKSKTELTRVKDTYKDRIKYLEEELAAAQKTAPPPQREMKQPVASVDSRPLAASPAPASAPVQNDGASKEALAEAEQERKDLLRRVSRLQQENAKLQAEQSRRRDDGASVPVALQAQPQPQQAQQPQQNTAGVSRPQQMQQNDMAVQAQRLQTQTAQRRARPAPEKNVAFMNERDIGGMFRQSGLETNDGIHKIDVGHDIMAHSWTAGRMFGSSEQSEMDYAGQYDSYVTRYLGKTEGRCPGDFASAASQEKQMGSIRVSTYEIACVGDENAASAAILFFNKDGVFTAIAHETTVDNMDIAMDTRDRLYDILTGDFDLSRRR